VRELRYREALREAMLEEMERDDRVFLMGEEVGHYQGAYKVSEGLLDKFGERRVIDTPIAEAGFAGVGIGAAMVGLRPIIEFMTWNFSFVAFDQIISNAAKVHQMSAGEIDVPIVFRGPNGAATPRDAKGLLKSAIRSNNPVVFLEGETLYGVQGEVPDEGVEELIPIGESRLARPGADCTIVTWGRPYYTVLAAAERLAAEGIECEVIDPRTLRPLDTTLMVQSVKKTNRCVVVHEHWPYGGPGAEIVDRLQREAFDYLDAPLERVAGLDVPMPYALNLEDKVLPTEDRVIDAVKRVSYSK